MKDQKRSRRPVRPLPDDVVMEILSRVPAYDVLKFRRVCRRWRALISTQYFAEMHLKAKAYSSPMILIHERLIYGKINDLLLLDKWEPPRKRPTIRKVRLNFIAFSGCRFEFGLSYDGLIVVTEFNPIRGSVDYIIFNPIIQCEVRIIRRTPEFGFYGMFFNPLVKEYCMLWGSFERGPNGIRYKMLNLGIQPCYRDLKQPTSFVHKPRHFSREPPVVMDDATLYWLVEYCYSNRTHRFMEYPSCEELIMAFDIKTEEFALMPHPGPTDDCCHSKHLNMHILKMDGRLSFLQSTITSNSFIINIWILKDSATRLWIKSHSVSINVDQLNINIGGLRDRNFGVMTFGNGELLLRYSERIYACNLQLGTVRRIGRKYKNSETSTYVPSFVSLKNCKSEIWI